MHIAEAVRVALQSLWANKLRSVLTLLGVVIGVGAVIAVLTFVSGINRYIAEKVFNLGADVFIINKQPSVITNIDQLLEAEKRKDITLGGLLRRCRGVQPMLRPGGCGYEPCRKGEIRPAIYQQYLHTGAHTLDAGDPEY